VAGLVLLGLVAAVAAILFQRHQTHRCLAFYGADHARRIAAAPIVELVSLEPGPRPAVVAARTRRDISRAAGLVHLRRGLVEDANFLWDDGRGESGAAVVRTSGPGGRLPLDAWDIALEFSEPAAEGAAPGAIARRTQLVFDLDAEAGAVAVVGQPGRIGLGRIAPGLRKWIRGLAEEAPDAPRP
jgi:hypothetical protein